MIRLPKIGKTNLSNVTLRPCSHTGNYLYTTFHRFINQKAFRTDRINSIYYKIILIGIQQFRYILIFQVDGQNGQFDIQIYIFITGSQYFRFRLSQCGMHGRQLTINIGGLHCIGIYNRHPSDACTADHLGGISTYSTQSHDQYVRAPDAFHLFLP